MNRRELLASAGVACFGTTRSEAGTAREASSEDSRDRRPDTYRNPVYDSIFADPDVLHADGTYYAYGTYHPWKPGVGPDRALVPVLKSPNLVDWEFVGPAFAERPDWSRYRGLWAPGVGYLDGRTLLYYSDAEFGARNEGVGVATAPEPTGPFESRGGLLRSEGIGVPNSIDPMLFVRGDDEPYLFWGSRRGIYGVRLAEDGLSVAGETFRIAGDGVEAPYVVSRGGFYYVFGSRGTCCRGAESTYHLVVGRAERLRGPYRNRDGGRLTAEGVTGTTILEGGDRFLAPGHCAVVRDERGGWWLLYHAYVRENPWVADTPRRVLMLDRIRWCDEWPVVGEDGTPSAVGRVPPVRKVPPVGE
ncbi:family 43 glycosylhydrolase [Halorussus gelatinilyticus]|uniref:Family 43 glycosylhydrolase n=1 Tax=Halorussus gelatinilyticus TaxID=2937524 RepID=A0A8U0ILR7_9EURY|nr:family 43 glycosylhydrolase [Halorussus gelatinilyticus]UPW02077.1 family 43 glycosylhydrolase [Halorussus gelatinilyticus]